MHRARARDATQVVAREIDEHDVLGVLLRIGEQLVLERDVVLGRRAARPRAGDRPQARRAAREPHERLGRRARDAQVAELEEVHVRRGVQQPQAAIGLERIEIGAAR